MTDRQYKIKDSSAQEHMLMETGRCDRAGRQAGNRDRVRERRETDRQTERDRWTCRQLDWMESGGQTGRRLPGNQTAGLMICSRHSQCETGRLAHNCSSATADIHPSDKSLPPSLPLRTSFFGLCHYYVVCYY